MKKLLAIISLTILTNVSHASLASQHGEQFATLIGMNGLVCKKVLKITVLRKADTYGVDCLEFSGKKSKIQYIVNMVSGIAFKR